MSSQAVNLIGTMQLDRILNKLLNVLNIFEVSNIIRIYRDQYYFFVGFYKTASTFYHQEEEYYIPPESIQKLLLLKMHSL